LIRIHAIQTGKVAVRTRQREGVGSGNRRFINTLLDSDWTEPLPIYCWLIEHPDGLVLVDTGETARAAEKGYFPGWHPYYRRGVREWVEPTEEVGPQLESLGVSASDLRWIILTHLHTDHAGGISHFPANEILVSRAEMKAASGTMGRLRGYLNNRWPESFRPTLVDFLDEPLGPFDKTSRVTGDGAVVLVATPGHSPGHLSVVVHAQNQTFFLAGDTSYTEELMRRRVVDGVSRDEAAARKSLERINQYIASEPTTVYLPSHDPGSEQRLSEATSSLSSSMNSSVALR
jgi:N-acyl homoserine lactone hydrolase